MNFLTYPATAEQKELIALAGELADRFAKRALDYDWEGRFPSENYDDLRKSGYLALTVPRDFGGQGASLLDVTMAQARLGQGCASTALAVSMHLTNVARLTEELTVPEEVYAELCRAVVEEGAMLNFAASEPATGSPTRGGRPTTTAYRQADGSWRITGRKTFTTGSLALQFFRVSCNIQDQTSGLEPLTVDQGNFLVPRHAAGLRIDETWNSLSMHGSGSNDLVLEDVHVVPNAFMGQSILKDRKNGWGLITTAIYLGIAQAARNEAIHFAHHRRPNSLDKPISSLPHIQEKVARMDLALLQSRALLFAVAEQASNDLDLISGGQLGAAKYTVTNQAIEIVDVAMRLVGAAGLSLQMPLQRYYRDVRAGLHTPPMDDSTFSMLAREALETS